MAQSADFLTKPACTYMLCGWHTRSDIRLTGVRTSERRGESVDVLVQIAPGQSPIATNLSRDFIEHANEGWLIKVQGVADFEISRGQQIRIWPAAGATQREIQVSLCGPAWATLCHQRGVLPLHASAIVTERGVIAFAGHSGAGKSTTAALMGLFGYELHAEDILPIHFDQNLMPGSWPYLRGLKLRSDSLIELALTSTEPVSELDNEKYIVYPKRIADDKWRRLERLYLLEIDPTGSGVSIDRITGAEAARALIDQTYYFKYILGRGQFHRHLAICTELARKLPIYHLRRPLFFGAGKEVGSRICAHLESAAI